MNTKEFLKYITADKVESAVKLLKATKDIIIDYDTLCMSINPSQACYTYHRLVISIFNESPREKALRLRYAFPAGAICSYREFCSITITTGYNIILSGYPFKEDYYINASNVQDVKFNIQEPNIIAFVKYVSKNFENIIRVAALACDMEVIARELDGRGAMKLEWSNDVAIFCRD